MSERKASVDMNKLTRWRKDESHLPKFLRYDEGNQGAIVREMVRRWNMEKPFGESLCMTTIHIFLIDYFLWIMASVGYTLQKTRSKNAPDFIPLDEFLDLCDETESNEKMAFYDAVIRSSDKT